MEENPHHTRLSIAIRAVTVWLVLIAAEILHGMARGIFLVPHVGEFRSSQIGAFTGSAIILVIALVFVRWISATRTTDLLAVGVLWLGLTLAFEILFGRFVVGASWERLAADYNVLEGGLLPFGMLVLALSPLIAAKLRAAINDQSVMSNDDLTSPGELNVLIAQVAEELRGQGQTEAAHLLADIQAVAFTTSSEWLGEVGLLVRRLQREFVLDASVRRDLKRIMRAVNRVWPRL